MLWFGRIAILRKLGNGFYRLNKQEDLLLAAKGKYIWESSIEQTECGALISTDEGKTFRKGRSVIVSHIIGEKKIWQWPEPSIAELSDGKLVMALRVNGTNYLHVSYSSDGGDSWSRPVATEIYNPGNKPKLIRLVNKEICLINTPNKGKFLTDRHPYSDQFLGKFLF